MIYDSLLTKKSTKQIKLFLNNKGYFNSKVKDSLSVRNKKATVHYKVYTGTPYHFRNINYEIKDYWLDIGQLDAYEKAKKDSYSGEINHEE